MRRPRPARRPPQRKPIGFEPLEPREMLFADAAFDWWSSGDAPVTDDWSWTFDDAWSGAWSDASGDGSWADPSWSDDAWWGGDAGANDPEATAIDAGDSGVSADTVAEPVDVEAEPVEEPGDAPVPTDAISPPVGDVDVSVVAEEIAGPVDVPMVDVPAVEPPSTDLSDVLPEVEAPTDGGPMDDGAPVGDVSTDVTDGPESLDTPLDGIVVDVPTIDPETPADDADEPVAAPITVVVTPVVTGPSMPSDASPVAGPIATSARSDMAFGAWGAFFFQAFGRPTDAGDGATTGGQPTSGRPRLRLPFRPLA